MKLNTSAGLVALLGHGDVIVSPHYTSFYDITIQFCSDGVKTIPKRDITFTFRFGKVKPTPK